MPNIPKPKPKNFSKILDILNTPEAAKTFSPKTYINLVGEYSKKAYDNGELSKKEYMDIVQPLFGDTGIMATEKIKKYEDELNKYADGGRIGFLEGGDTAYNAMVFRMYTEAGGQEGTGMDIDTFAEKYFPKMAQGGRIGYSEGSDDYFDEQKTNVKGKKTTGPVKGGKTPEIPPEEFQKYLKYKKNKVVKAATGGRIGYNQGSLDPDTLALKEKIEEIMDIEGVGFGEAFKQAMRELASQSKEND